MRFNSPPGWPTPPPGWVPPTGWTPDPAWPAPPEGWQLWISDDTPTESDAPRHRAHGVPEPELVQTDSIDSSTAAEVAPLLRRIAELETALRGSGDADLVELNDQRVLQDVGIYRYHHPLEDAAGYKDRLIEINADIDATIKAGHAILAADLFTFDGSLAKGRKMVADLSKLMLRAYNAEADNCVRSLRNGNITTAKKRLENAMNSIEKLGVMMEMRVSPEYHQLRVEELELTADYQMKVQEEREQARQERELLREQRKAEEELKAERERLEKERAHYESALEQLRINGDDAAADDLAKRLHEIEEAIEANDYRIANVRAGYVYVISNVGSFGPNIVKIGLTRRLEPRDRVVELGDASVPFRYDTHALYFSEDAVTLENELHKAFAHRRVNFVNERREFFFATPREVRDVLMQKVGGLLEYNETPDAPEFYQSLGHWPEEARPARSSQD